MENATGIVPGNTVVLKSGGPVMTVQARSDNLAYCCWLEGSRVQHGTFALDTLQLDSVQPAPAALRRAG